VRNRSDLLELLRAGIDADGDTLFTIEDYLTLLPKRKVERLVRDSPFSQWTVTGHFSDDPLVDGRIIQVWRLRKAGD